MNKCPFCQSEKLVVCGRGSSFHKNYREVKEQRNTLYSATSCREWSIYYLTNKMLCLNCGLVHERLSEEKIAEYLANEKFMK